MSKVNVLVNAVAVADLDGGLFYPKSPEDHAKQLERLAREFNDFVKDHRSMDWVSLSVNREYEDQCSHCGALWETDEDNVPVCCQTAADEHLEQEAANEQAQNITD